MHLKDADTIRFDDGLNIDLFYVCRGSIEITLRPVQTEWLKDRYHKNSESSEDQMAHAHVKA